MLSTPLSINLSAFSRECQEWIRKIVSLLMTFMPAAPIDEEPHSDSAKETLRWRTFSRVI